MIAETLAALALVVPSDRLAAAVSAEVGHPVRVVCVAGLADTSGYVGLAYPELAFVYLDLAAVCVPLDRGVIRGTGSALLALAHEVEHLRGDRDEARAECAGLRNAARFAILRLGARPGRLLHDVMAQALAYHRSLPASYRAGCP